MHALVGLTAVFRIKLATMHCRKKSSIKCPYRFEGEKGGVDIYRYSSIKT